MTTLLDLYSLECPCCHNSEHLLVTITAVADLTVDGTDPSGDHDWSNDNRCGCPLCGQSGTVADFIFRKGGSA